ncbi:DNA polymerase III subunit delta, partial [Lactobacillus sp. XV13L]|nr:DNA polymerase III subunit delta [Lactobacillus sp. XV13L]
HEATFADKERVTVDCASDSLDELIAELTESSLFSQQKVITVKNPFFLTSKVPKKFQKQVQQLQGIFEHIDQLDDVVVLVASYDKLDRRKKLTKTALKQFNVVDAHVKAYEAGKVVRGIIAAEGYQIANADLQLLLE